MDKEELKFVLQEREGLKIEFKESFDKSIAKEIVAFANADGGRIFLGVTDDGKIKGIKITNKLKSQIHDLARNSLVANLLAKTSYVEKLGTGINRIKKAMSNAKLPEPEFKFNGSFFATLYDKTYLGERVGVKVGERVGVKVGERLTINQIKILKEIDKDRFISAETLSEKVGISKRKIEENISKLKKMGLLKRIGPAKGGHWKVLK